MKYFCMTCREFMYKTEEKPVDGVSTSMCLVCEKKYREEYGMPSVETPVSPTT